MLENLRFLMMVVVLWLRNRKLRNLKVWVWCGYACTSIFLSCLFVLDGEIILH